MTLGRVSVKGGIVGDGETMMRLVSLNGVDDSGVRQRRFQKLPLLVGKPLALGGAAAVHIRLHGTRLVVGTVGIVRLGQVAAVERRRCGDAAPEDARGEERQTPAHALPSGA